MNSNATAIKIMPPTLNFNELCPTELNFFLSVLNLFDESSQAQLLKLIEEEIIFVRINSAAPEEININLA